MRGLWILGAMLVVSSSSAAWAQDSGYQGNAPQAGSYSGTLDEQVQRLHQGLPAVPQGAPAAAAPAYAPAPAAREWPAASGDDARPDMGIASQGDGAIPALLPQEYRVGNILYINGGIGDEDEATFKAYAADFNLHLLISATTGEYVSNITLHVLDAHGTLVLSIDDAGPYVYAQLPPGSYTLQATSPSDGTKTLKVKIPAKGGIKEHFAFNE